ncbi:hypothetical protein L345_16227, partial [Ophiophagus hannah]
MLVFETYYHIGVAFQSMHNHQEALEEFSFALETAHIPKNVCQVGCASGSFYQIPVLTRRAYSYVKCGKIKEAIRDSTRAVNLDSSNPALALSWNSKDFCDVEDFYHPKMLSFYDKHGFWLLCLSCCDKYKSGLELASSNASSPGDPIYPICESSTTPINAVQPKAESPQA